MISETLNAEETQAAGAQLARRLRPGDVVLVSGELGSGKTTFVRGAAHALGVRGPVKSPTFTIGQVLAGSPDVAHLDLYRLDSRALEDPALLDDYLTPDRVAFVEWPSPGEPALERVAVRVTLEHLGGDRRRIAVEGFSDSTRRPRRVPPACCARTESRSKQRPGRRRSAPRPLTRAS